jgi:hypothetical protein
MTDVGTALDAEVVYIVCLTLCAAGGKAQHRHGYHSQGNECLFHYCVFLFILFSNFLPQTSYFLPSIIPCRIQGDDESLWRTSVDEPESQADNDDSHFSKGRITFSMTA